MRGKYGTSMTVEYAKKQEETAKQKKARAEAARKRGAAAKRERKRKRAARRRWLAESGELKAVYRSRSAPGS